MDWFRFLLIGAELMRSCLFRDAGGVFEQVSRLVARVDQDAIGIVHHQLKADRRIHIAAGRELALHARRRVSFDSQGAIAHQCIVREQNLSV